jgi:molybdate transport system substrate-binding protein
MEQRSASGRYFCFWCIALVIGAISPGCSRPESRGGVTLTASVAASLQNVMTELAPVYERLHPEVKVSFNFGGSGTLEQQIEHGAPADVFLSAAPKPMDELAGKGLILPDTRRDLVRNELVLVIPKGATRPTSFRDLTDASVKIIALGDPGSVPAGDYGRQVLQALGVWATVQLKLVLAKDVRQVLTYVEGGNAEAGLVYATDARESDKVRVAEIAPANSHAPVVYPVAVTKDSRNIPAAKALVAFLADKDAASVFARHGFTTIGP